MQVYCILHTLTAKYPLRMQLGDIWSKPRSLFSLIVACLSTSKLLLYVKGMSFTCLFFDCANETFGSLFSCRLHAISILMKLIGWLIWCICFLKLTNKENLKFRTNFQELTFFFLVGLLLDSVLLCNVCRVRLFVKQWS